MFDKKKKLCYMIQTVIKKINLEMQVLRLVDANLLPLVHRVLISQYCRAIPCCWGMYKLSIALYHLEYENSLTDHGS
jgi:hypothetical protein